MMLHMNTHTTNGTIRLAGILSIGNECETSQRSDGVWQARNGMHVGTGLTAELATAQCVMQVVNSRGGIYPAKPGGVRR